MKKLVGFIFIILVFYSVYNDFHRGSLPAVVSQEQPKVNTVKQEQPTDEVDAGIRFFEKEIQPGDTVISVLEDQLNEPIPVPISDVVQDFVQLNNGIQPEEIKFGESYKFPDYRTVQ